MRLHTLRWIDKYIGLFLCFVLFCFQRIIKLFDFLPYRRSLPKPVRKILIIKFWGFGSIVLALDFLQLLRRNYPLAQIYAVTLRQNRKIYEMSGLCDGIADIDIKQMPLFLFELIRLVFFIRRSAFDVAFDLEFTSRFSAFFTYLSGAKKRLGFKYSGAWRGACFTQELAFSEEKKLRHSYLDLAGLLIRNIILPDERIILRIEQAARYNIEAFLDENGLIGIYPLIGININAGELSFLRRWPREYFVVLAQELISKYNAHLIFVGSKEDAPYVYETLKMVGFPENVHSLAGRAPLPDLANLLGKLHLFISNDSGPLHLAVYLNIPTISFFGPETPLIYGPEGDMHIVFYRNNPCSPCMRVKNYKYSHCDNDQACLKGITPADVIEAIATRRVLSGAL
ncbi:MAG: glycosyltransferase family 9 protein [Candidatus Omnitrophota bacterium]